MGQSFPSSRNGSFEREQTFRGQRGHRSLFTQMIKASSSSLKCLENICYMSQLIKVATSTKSAENIGKKKHGKNTSSSSYDQTYFLVFSLLYPIKTLLLGEVVESLSSPHSLLRSNLFGDSFLILETGGCPVETLVFYKKRVKKNSCPLSKIIQFVTFFIPKRWRSRFAFERVTWPSIKKRSQRIPRSL